MEVRNDATVLTTLNLVYFTGFTVWFVIKGKILFGFWVVVYIISAFPLLFVLYYGYEKSPPELCLQVCLK